MNETAITVFQKNDSIIYWGDALVALRQQIPDASVDLIFVDPPYNIGKRFGEFVDKWPTEVAYIGWCYEWLDLCIAKLKSSGSMYIMASTQSMPYIDIYVRQKLTILSRLVWSYDSSGVQARKYYGSMYEPILYCVKDAKNYTFNADAIQIEAKTGAQRRLIDYRKPIPTPYNTTKLPGNVWDIPRVRYRMNEYEEHPSQKPEELLERIIKASTQPGDSVLDPFAGTFTTCAVAQKLGRKAIGIELQEQYIKIGLRRLAIQNEWNGQPLRTTSKTYKHRTSTQQITLLGEQ